MSQTNGISNCVPPDDRFRFIDDLTTLEIIKILSIGLATYNLKQHIPSNIPTHGQIIDRQHLKSQKYLDEINSWSKEHKIHIAELKKFRFPFVE